MTSVTVTPSQEPFLRTRTQQVLSTQSWGAEDTGLAPSRCRPLGHLYAGRSLGLGI